ncbi:hypothetical protein LCGC14_1646870 [marine sediment metagenome]|uniref:Uncharacterized protein n=1 Tax=marine sediment metagenome TaxID=412755 RepID=A0A0F9KDU7_9ZZZZ
MLDRVTITGADDAVDVEELAALADEFPFTEWGILLSQSRMGQPRYPTFEWIRELLEAKKERLPFSHHRFQLSGHLCEKWVI